MDALFFLIFQHISLQPIQPECALHLSKKTSKKKKKKVQMYSKVHNEISNGNFSLILSPFSFELLQHHFIWKAQGEINKKQRIQNMCQISFKSEKI